ncbi:MAG: hypothetical protein HC912_08630 [Saprospiraceae bacterium]|nr:hypothetical protein [Saprospiraceae bacterium]
MDAAFLPQVPMVVDNADTLKLFSDKRNTDEVRDKKQKDIALNYQNSIYFIEDTTIVLNYINNASSTALMHNEPTKAPLNKEENEIITFLTRPYTFLPTDIYHLNQHG